MAFDGLFTYSITADLQQLVTGRITKIHQPNAQEVILHVRANGKIINYCFLSTLLMHAFT